MKLILSILLLSISATLHAEIHKEALVCEKAGGICFYWWPELPTIDGWQQDKDNSFRYSMNAQAPIGFNFGNAETVIYAKAIYKAAQPETKNLDEFIKNDHASFLAKDSTIKIQELSPVTNSVANKLKSFSFTPQKSGNWERVTYGEESDKEGNQYFLTFVVSSRTESGYNNAMATYVQFINQYK